MTIDLFIKNSFSVEHTLKIKSLFEIIIMLLSNVIQRSNCFEMIQYQCQMIKGCSDVSTTMSIFISLPNFKL